MNQGTPSGRISYGALRTSTAEVVLIVVGVLIALSLEAVWQERSDRRAEGALMASLRVEFQENSGALERWIELHARLAAAAEAFLDQLETVPEGEVAIIPDSLIGELGRTPTFDPELNSLDAALSSGHISLITSPEIQRGLANWRQLLEDAQEEEHRAAEQAYREFLPLLGESAEMGPAVAWLVEDVRQVMRGSSNGPRPTSSSAVRADRRLVNALWIRYRLTRSAENELQILRETIHDLLSLLEGGAG